MVVNEWFKIWINHCSYYFKEEIMKNYIILLVTSLLITISVKGQVNISSEVQESIEVFGSSESFIIKIENFTGSDLSTSKLVLDLPIGIEYEANSNRSLTGHQFVENNVLSSTSLIFDVGVILSGDSAKFSINTTANLLARDQKKLGKIFRNKIQFFHDKDTLASQSSSYQILFPAISILNISPKRQTLSSGSTGSRDINFINAGNGAAYSLFITDFSSPEVEIKSVSLGTLNATQDTIFLDADDFVKIGNRDSKFDRYETLTITENLKVTGCKDLTVSSRITPYWGKENSFFEEDDAMSYTSIDYLTPNISLSTTSGFGKCFASGEPYEQQIKLTNNGAGIANNISLLIYKSKGGSYDQTILSRIDPSSFRYKIGNGNEVPITPYLQYQTINTGFYSCLGNNAIGKVQISLPDITAGETIILKWDMIFCELIDCSINNLKGWKAELSYQDGCSKTYKTSKVGQHDGNQKLTIFPEYDIDVFDDKLVEINYLLTSYANDLPIGDGAHFKFDLQLPPGLTWSGNRSDLTWNEGPNQWLPDEVRFDNTTNKLSGIFYVSDPLPIDVKLSELKVNLKGVCGTSGWNLVEFKSYYTSDTNCRSLKYNVIGCNNDVNLYLHCSGACVDGIGMEDFSLNRISYGKPDNNLDGKPDVTGTLDYTKVRQNRLFPGDTLQANVKSNIKSSSLRFAYGRLKMNIKKGQSLSILSSKLRVFRTATNEVFNCDISQIIESNSGDDKLLEFDFSVSKLGCSYTSFKEFKDKDSIEIDIQFLVSNNIGGELNSIIFDNDIYVSEIDNPGLSDQYSCSKRYGRVTNIGYELLVTSEKNVGVNSCSKAVNKEFKLSIGNCCSNLGGTDFFPYEYRHIAYPELVKIKVPNGYTIDKTTFKHDRTVYANKTESKSINISPNAYVNDTAFFNISDYFDGLNLIRSDEGFYDRMTIYLNPECTKTPNVYESLPWVTSYKQNESIGVNNLLSFNKQDNVKYLPPQIDFSSSERIKDGIQNNVVWDLEVKNTSKTTHANNSWVQLVTPNNVIIDSVVLNGNRLQLNGNIYQLGQINKNSSKKLFVYASYNTCNYSSIKVYGGYNCDNYPTDFNSSICPVTQFNLDISPKKTDIQTLTSKQMIGDLCGTRLEIEQEVSSVYWGNAYELKLDVIYPLNGSINYESGSSQFLYSGTSYSTIADPVINGNVVTYDLSSLDNELKNNGLPGILDINNNTLKLKFISALQYNFKQGDYVKTRLKGVSACGDSLPVIYLAHDPTSKFSEDNLSGLDIDAIDSWSASWGDYNNDGFDDIFLPNYQNNGTNLLYKNNKDGTFSKVSGGSVTQDLGSAVSATWGDYDNDGDLDLFVANNTQSNNNLYRNNGDETFTKVMNDDISNHGGYCHGSSWVDVNNDGFLDMFVTDYWRTDFNALFLNNQDGTFSKVTQGMIVNEASSSISNLWSDYDNDGDMDVFIANTNDENNSLYRNDNGVFTKITNGSIVSDGGKSVGGSWGDYDNDGDMDLFVANTSNQLNFLYENQGNGTFSRVRNGVIANSRGNSSGSTWGDFNNDGHLDLIVTNDLNQNNEFFANNGDGTFTRVANEITKKTNNSFGTAYSDYDNDGDIDLFIANRGASTNDFFVNEQGNCNSYICIKLIGSNSNKSAIGAKLRLKTIINGREIWQTREVVSQTGGGSGGQNSLKTIFGLGNSSIVDSLVIFWPSGFYQVKTNLQINTCHEITEVSGTKIFGKVFNDMNSNCLIDTADFNIRNMQIKILPIGRVISTNMFGEFEAYLPDGNYQIMLNKGTEWQFHCVDTAYKIFIDGESQLGEFNFALKANCPNPDLAVDISTSAVRRGFKSDYIVNVKNIGATAATNNQLKVNLNPEIIPLTSTKSWDSIIYYQDSTLIFFNVSTINPGEQFTIRITDSVSLNLNIEDTVYAYSTIYTNDSECDLTNNYTYDNQIVVGAIDPNDKLTLHKSYGNMRFVEFKDTLNYKIRFQNVGNYSAARVLVVDTLSKSIDFKSIHQIESSHEGFNFTIDEKGILKWEFLDIDLPDSNTNEPGSHGFVSFKALLKKDIPEWSQVKNKAYIQFDYNKFIKTNTVFNTVVSSLEKVMTENELSLGSFPNPTRDKTNLYLNTPQKNRIPISFNQYTIQDVKGNIVQQKSTEQYVNEISLDNLNPGVYFIRITDLYNKSYTCRVIKM